MRPRVFVEADDQADVACTGGERVIDTDEGGTTRRTAVVDIEEGQAGGAQIGHHGIGVAR